VKKTQNYKFPNGELWGPVFSFMGALPQAAAIWAAAAGACGESTPFRIKELLLNSDDLIAATLEGTRLAVLDWKAAEDFDSPIPYPETVDISFSGGRANWIGINRPYHQINLCRNDANWGVGIQIIRLADQSHEDCHASRRHRVWEALREMGLPLEFIFDVDGKSISLPSDSRGLEGKGFVRPREDFKPLPG